MGWLRNNFDPTIFWNDLDWIRSAWKAPLITKGILDPEDAKSAAAIGADGIVVSNHGGRQLDRVLSTAKALPAIAEAVGDRLTVLADSGIRSGLDVVWMLALAARGQPGVAQLLDLIANEMRVAMTPTGTRRVSDISQTNLVPSPG
jgi:L-lactate dehydrogenase (cytochrome)